MSVCAVQDITARLRFDYGRPWQSSQAAMEQLWGHRHIYTPFHNPKLAFIVGSSFGPG